MCDSCDALINYPPDRSPVNIYSLICYIGAGAYPEICHTQNTAENQIVCTIS